ncbi:MAG: PH domain-containing protein [Bdellovibrionales bacterium]
MAKDQPSKNQDKKKPQKRQSNSKSSKRKRSARSSIKSMLVDGEQVIEKAVISNGIYWKAVAVLVFAIIFALLVVVEIGILLAVVSLLMFIHATVTREILMLVLTDRRIFVRYGILQVDVVDIRFSKIESMELERMLPGYIFGYSSLVIMGTGNRYIVIPFVANGVQIRRSYNRMTLTEDEPQEVIVVQKKADQNE